MVSSTSTLVLSRAHILSNFAGAGGGVMVILHSHLLVRLSTLSGNTAKQRGGSVYVTQGTSLVLNDSWVSDSQAAYGGGVFVDAGVFTSSNGTIDHCEASQGGVWVSLTFPDLGRLYFESYLQKVTLLNVVCFVIMQEVSILRRVPLQR